MKRKDLIKLIKDKSKEVEVKDFSNEILMRVKNGPETVVTTERKQRVRPKPVFIGSLMAVLTVFILLLVYYPNVVSAPTKPQFADMDNVLMFSSISTTSLLEDNETEDLSQTGNILLSTNQVNSGIDDEIANLVKYFGILEQLYASNFDFDYKLTKVNKGMQMRFKSKAFLDEEMTYQINYAEAVDEITKTLKLEGSINVGNKQYSFSANTNQANPNQVLLRTEVDALNYVDTEYTVNGNEYNFDYSIYNNGLKVDEVSFILYEEVQQRFVEIFLGDAASNEGFKFKTKKQAGRIVFNVDYYLKNNETGELLIKVNEGLMGNEYDIMVKPDNGGAYKINHTRGIGKGRNK